MSLRKIHEELTLEVPESFRELPAQELDQLYGGSNPNRWGAWDEEQHIILAVFWHENSGLLGLLTNVADAKAVAESNEIKMKKAMGGSGYRREGFFPAQVAGKPAYGFRYSYRAGDVPQVGEAISFFRDKTCYTLYYYARLDQDEPRCREVFRAVLQSAALAE